MHNIYDLLNLRTSITKSCTVVFLTTVIVFFSLFLLIDTPLNDALSACAYIFGWYLLPGLVMAAAFRIPFGSSNEFVAYALALGLSTQSVTALIAWVTDAFILYQIVPGLFFLLGAWLAIRRRPQNATKSEAPLMQALEIVGVLTVLCLVLPSLVGWKYINVHHTETNMGVEALITGWPPQNPAVQGLLYRYDYLSQLHLLFWHKITSTPLELLTSRIAPVFFSALTMLLFAAFGRRVLKLSRCATVLAVISTFLILKASIINLRFLIHTVLPPTALVISPLFGFIFFLLMLTHLSEKCSPTKIRLHDYFLVLISSFILTGGRGLAGPVMICTIGFYGLITLFATRRIPWRLAPQMLACIGGCAFALWFFLGAGTDFSGTSHAETHTTVNYILESDKFPLSDWLRNLYLTPTVAAVVAFCAAALFQGMFLTPFFFLKARDFIKGVRRSPEEVLLWGTYIAGVCATFLTSAPGGSHFGFLQYATFAATLLGAKGFDEYRANHPVPRKKAPYFPLTPIYIATALLAFLHLYDTGISYAKTPYSNYINVIKRADFASPAKKNVHMKAAELLGNLPDKETAKFYIFAQKKNIFERTYDRLSLEISVYNWITYAAEPKKVSLYASWKTGKSSYLEKINNLTEKAFLKDEKISLHALCEVINLLPDEKKPTYVLSTNDISFIPDIPFTLQNDTVKLLNLSKFCRS